MGIPIIGDIINAVKDLAGEVIVDKDKKNDILFKIEQLKDNADQRFHDELMGQIEVNKVEAAHSSIFVSGWRPFIGWTGGVGLAYTFVASPFIEFIARVFGYTEPMPVLETGQLMALVTAMLGVGAMRSFDKKEGTATTTVSKKK